MWNGRSEGPARFKVAWEFICVPKDERGLGIKRAEDWNRAAVLKYIWPLFTKAGSLWVAWVKANSLKGRCFWKIKVPLNCSWCWWKILGV